MSDDLSDVTIVNHTVLPTVHHFQVQKRVPANLPTGHLQVKTFQSVMKSFFCPTCKFFLAEFVRDVLVGLL